VEADNAAVSLFWAELPARGTMKNFLKRLLESKAPFLLDAYRSINNRRLFRRRHGSLQKRMHVLFFGGKKIKVLSGPFKELNYFNEIVWGSITPKWLGSYEHELNKIIEEIVSRDYAVIIDIGCAEGYYAVGLAYRIPGVQILAYDTDFVSRRQTRKLARLNGLEGRVKVSDYCSGTEIAQHASDNPLIVCDIEGFERSLLDPVSCPSLLKLDILVEVHEVNRVPSTLDLLKSRFSASHSLEHIVATDRDEWIRRMMNDARLPIGREHLYEAVNEHRSNGFRWLWMKANNCEPI